ncbi:hypothetical protein [Paenibacillus lactis]|uniref:hypothetical protein n=1 Tax=Paenibacillus lactis TaxID=228574 RepID=UPI003D714578
MSTLGLTEQELLEIGVAAKLDSVTNSIKTNRDFIERNELDRVLDEGAIEYRSTLQAVAAMIAENNRRVAEQLQSLVHLKE